MGEGKRKLEVLDALRGVCALVVMVLHFSENYPRPKVGGTWLLPHGCLPVEFFFILTGFMFVYAYDGRWNTMSLVGFFRRRLVRLQPLVVFGSLIGAASFLIAPEAYARIVPGGSLTLGQLALLTLWCCTLLPAPRLFGWGHLHPLQGPLWTLFWIYVANVLYALVLRHLRTWLLSALAIAAAGLTFWFGIQTGGFHYGPSWSWGKQTLESCIFSSNAGAIVRMLFPVLAGMVIARKGWKIRTGNWGLWLCTAILLAIFLGPNYKATCPTANGILESAAVVVGFPLVMLLGIGGEIRNGRVAAVCRFLGKFSFPLYTTHYSLTLIERTWRAAHPDAPWQMHLAVIAAFAFFAVLNALVAMRFADWASNRLSKGK